MNSILLLAKKACQNMGIIHTKTSWLNMIAIPKGWEQIGPSIRNSLCCTKDLYWCSILPFKGILSIAVRYCNGHEFKKYVV